MPGSRLKIFSQRFGPAFFFAAIVMTSTVLANDDRFTFDRFPSSSPSTTPKRAFLFLHGFPGDSGKNEDLANLFAQQTSSDAFVLHYPGLGRSNKEFLFSSAFKEAEDFATYLHDELGYSRIDIVGHSFGAWVGLHLLASRTIYTWMGQVIFLNPLSEIPNDEAKTELVKWFVEDRATKGHRYDQNVLFADLKHLEDTESPRILVKKIDLKQIPVLVFQGLQDEVVDPKATTRFVSQLRGSRIQLIRMRQDHWFSKRKTFQNRCLDALARLEKK